MTTARALACILLVVLAAAAAGPGAPANRICDNRTGMHAGLFYTFWKSSGSACMTLGARGHYTSRYSLGPGENLVLGTGWRTGSTTRKVGYKAASFDAGTNSYLTLYGWSTDPLVEYYVVDNWGSGFTPPGAGSALLGTVASDGGTYNIYRTQRVQQPSIRGTQTFYQYWSVRTARRAVGGNSTISFANHVAAWRQQGMRLGRMNYQVLATEGFGSSGASDVLVWEDKGER